MNEDITKAVLELLKTYPKLNSFLFFNTNEFSQGRVTLHTVTSQAYEIRYIRDAGIKYNSYEVIVVKPYDNGTSEVNYNEYLSVKDFMVWIGEQNKKEILSKFNPNILSIECEQNEPRLMGIAEDEIKAQYSFPIKVRYEYL